MGERSIYGVGFPLTEGCGVDRCLDYLYSEVMNMSRLRSASALPLLLLVACATINVDPPALPEMPAAPEVVLSTPPMRPSVVPRPPAPPSSDSHVRLLLEQRAPRSTCFTQYANMLI